MSQRFSSSALFGCFTIALLVASCSKKGSEQPELPDPDTQQDITAVDNKISTFMSTHNIPGATLAVSKNGKLVYVKAYGFSDQAAAVKATPDDRFRIASVSKTYTGVAILKMVQEGRFSLDAKVFGPGNLLSTEFGSTPYNANLSNMTVRQLLQNTSGSWGASTGGDVIDQNPQYTNGEFFNWFLSTRPNPKTPGTFYDYSNINFWIAGRIIGKVSGKSYISYIREDLLAPLGITQTDIAGKTATDRKPNEVKYYGQGTDANYVYNIAFPRRDADGGLITTAKDLLKFVTAIDGFTSRPDVLNSTSLAALTTGSTPNPGYACGIGNWAAENVWYNYGSLPGTRSGFMRHANGMCVALILNSRANPSNETPFVQGMQNTLLDLVKNNSYNWQDIDQF